MIRLIVRTDNAGMAANCGGSVLSTFQSLDVDLPELERALGIDKVNIYSHAQVIGAEIVAEHPNSQTKEQP